MGPLDSKKKLHLISWKKISTPKKDDAFDLFAIEAKNTVLLANSTKEKKKKKLFGAGCYRINTQIKGEGQILISRIMLVKKLEKFCRKVKMFLFR